MNAHADTPLSAFLFRHSAYRVQFGAGCLDELPSLLTGAGAKQVALVLDGFFRRGELRSRLRELLPPPAFRLAVHHPPVQEPDTDSVGACRDFLAQAEPDAIVAIGGGSTMDTAKVARLLLANPGNVVDNAGFDRDFAPHDSLLVCVPTTAGTAAEVSEMAVVGQAGSDIKLRFRSQAMTARHCLLDPQLLLSLPPAVTAHTGFDAFTHALESFVSRAANPVTDPLAADALARLARWLPIAFSTPADAVARGHCLLASMLAGIAFNSTQLGLAHALSAPLGARFHVAHGLANALVLPAVVAWNTPALGDKRERIADLLGAADAVEGVVGLRARLGLDRGLDEFVPDAAGRAAVARAAMRSGNVPFNPRSPAPDDVDAIVEASRAPLHGARPPLAV